MKAITLGTAACGLRKKTMLWPLKTCHYVLLLCLVLLVSDGKHWMIPANVKASFNLLTKYTSIAKLSRSWVNKGQLANLVLQTIIASFVNIKIWLQWSPACNLGDNLWCKKPTSASFQQTVPEIEFAYKVKLLSYNYWPSRNVPLNIRKCIYACRCSSWLHCCRPHLLRSQLVCNCSGRSSR